MSSLAAAIQVPRVSSIALSAGWPDWRRLGVGAILLLLLTVTGGCELFQSMGFGEPEEPIARPVPPKKPVVKAPKVLSYTVVLDAGHGGKDPGGSSACIGRKILEKEVALDVVLRLAKDLEMQGVKTYLTRRDDHYLPLIERAKIANQRADLNVSVHANASSNASASGAWMIYQDPSYPMKSTSASSISGDRLGLSLGASAADKQRVLNSIRVRNATLGRMFADILARRFQGTSKVRVMRDERNLCVLREVIPPSVLIELGFLTNVSDCQKLANSSDRQRYADLIAASIVEYLKR